MWKFPQSCKGETVVNTYGHSGPEGTLYKTLGMLSKVRFIIISY